MKYNNQTENVLLACYTTLVFHSVMVINKTTVYGPFFASNDLYNTSPETGHSMVKHPIC